MPTIQYGVPPFNLAGEQEFRLHLAGRLLADAAALSDWLRWAVRLGVPLAAILISAGFFFSVLSPTATHPGQVIALIYVGAIILAISVIILGIGLLRPARWQVRTDACE